MEPWVIVVILGAAAILYGMMLPKRQAEVVSTDKMVKEVEATLEQYMAEIETENVELVELISQMKQDMGARQLAQQEQLTGMRQRLAQLEQHSIRLEGKQIPLDYGILPETDAAGTELVQTAAAQEKETDLSETEEQAVEEEVGLGASDASIKNRYPELFELYQQGKSVDVIGKATGMHRGEVQLILQLAKQEESP